MIKMKLILDEQATSHPYESKLARQIYDAKGFVWDNEIGAVKAILAIKDANQFNLVQKELQKLTSGRGIGQYVSSFITVRDSMNSKYAPITINYIKRIISHLSQIKANPESINIFNTKLKEFEKWSKLNNDLAQSSGAMGGQLAWETFTERAKKDPEFKHAYLQTLQFMSYFIPGAGAFIAAGIGLVDAAAYYVEGDNYSAGAAAIFAAIPLAGGVVSKLPVVRKLGAKGMAMLGEKLATSKNPALNWLETQVIKDMSKYKDVLKKDMTNYFKKRAQTKAAQLARYQVKNKAAKIVSKIGDGTLSLSKFAGKGYATFKAWDWAYGKSEDWWNKYYTDNFLKYDVDKDIEDITNI